MIKQSTRQDNQQARPRRHGRREVALNVLPNMMASDSERVDSLRKKSLIDLRFTTQMSRKRARN